MEKRLRHTFSSLAGNEALSDAPDENAAAEILKWSEELARYFVLQTGEMEDAAAEEFLAPYVRALRTMMRAVSGWSAEPDPAIRLEWWDRIEQSGKTLYGEQFALPAMEEVVTELPSEGSMQQIVEFLRKVIENQAAKG
ncbi:MAG TPA: hypothetical protein VFR47_10950 [Anaerolineales bacterium]|nr:hypothetical protein [Anaerolineales bacterium]